MLQRNNPLYLDIYKQLLKKIQEGEYPDGKLPTEKEIADYFQVSRITTKKAFELLVAQGYIHRIPGRGSFVIPDHEKSELQQIPAEIPKTEEQLKKEEPPLVCIGLIIEEIGESFGALTIAGAEKTCAEHGCSLLLKCSYGDQKKEEKAIQELLQMGVQGLIIMPVHGINYNSAILRLSVENFPLVLIDRELKGIPASFVGTDNYQAAFEITNHLFELGHKELCFVSPVDTGTSSILERRRGFIEANFNHGVLIRENQLVDGIKSTLPYNNTEQMLPDDIKLIMDYIRSTPTVTAFFAAEYNIALIIYQAVKNLGCQIPEDISIVCFDSPPNFIRDYRFTFVQQKERLMGERSVKLLLEILNGSKEIKKVYIDTEIVQGRYTGKNTAAEVFSEK